ncbi:hypothetical protein QEN19_001901 [Hanseniaspora menglaensis]
MNHIESVEYLPLNYNIAKSNLNEPTELDNGSHLSNDQISLNTDTDNETSRGWNSKKKKNLEEEEEKKNNKIESRIMGTLLDNLKLTKNFYFSYTYDLTNSLQTNLLREKLKLVDRTDISIPYNQMKSSQSNVNYNDLFIWNKYLLECILNCLDTAYDWFQPIIHGFIDQIDIPILSNSTSNKISVCIIARRSRQYAGLRFLKRGISNEGYVANEVESEQIVSNSSITSFHDNQEDNIKFYGNNKYTSFLQHRGSIPLNWSQDLNLGIKLEDNDQLKADNISENQANLREGNYSKYKDIDNENKIRIKTKPPINMYLMDPYYRNAAKHFNDLFARYGGNKIMVLDLLKQNTSKKKTKKKFTMHNDLDVEEEDDDTLKGRESVLGKEYRDCIYYLNQFLPDESKIEYIGFDMSKVSKQLNNTGENRVIEFLESYAAKVIKKLGVFQNSLLFKDIKLQSGIVRVSCQDCLDRTNASQFIIGKKALAEQLRLLNILPEKYINQVDDAFVEYDSLISNLYTNLYQAHGNTIALQYGSSHLVNTISSYRKDLRLKNGWRRESSNNLRDFMESFKRYYNNSFYDAGRQEAINIFLGVWKYNPKEPLFWNLKTDYYLHNNNKSTENDIFNTSNTKMSYRLWYTPEFLTSLKEIIKKEIIDLNNDISIEKYRNKLKDFPKFIDSYWSTSYDLGQYTDLKNELEYNLFIDNVINFDLEVKDKPNSDIVREAPLYELFEGDKKIGKTYHNKFQNIQISGENEYETLMGKYDTKYGKKNQYVEKLKKLKESGLVETGEEDEDQKINEKGVEKFYEKYKENLDKVVCFDELIYMTPPSVEIDDSLYCL